MNERLKELRKQAIDFCLDRGSQGNLSEEVSAKFAELIVRECAKVSSDQVMDVEGNDWGVSWAVKKHFGVE